MKHILYTIFCFSLCLISIACSSHRDNVVAAPLTNANEQKVLPAASSPEPLTEKDLKRRAEIHEKMLKGEYLHDGSLELARIGDISSVPALLVVLKKNPPSKNGAMICTAAHALKALRTVTNANPGITYDEWNKWWENYQKEQTSKTEQ